MDCYRARANQVEDPSDCASVKQDVLGEGIRIGSACAWISYLSGGGKARSIYMSVIFHDRMRIRLVQEHDIPNLHYINACAREALRLHPMGSFNLPHHSVSDCVVAGYFIPKGSNILLSRLGLGRNPRVWEDPMRFDPERHLKEGGYFHHMEARIINKLVIF
ncbi:hypothetical protein FNV43_RR02700 [Rhamnella rubrinervis]|uniref:Uncharacterized protein n=1 Tax=Rhamnella rubrinervis TaxID=2594499 RepID=A0A8K0HGD0_9ROSA|nr:hypothetical protein FNV43_RR02700 [Rhamnella rubrinervis]